MKANEFFRSMGLDAVKGFIKNGNIRTPETELELKRLVESHELVSEFFNLEALGFDKAIKLAKKQIEELEDNEAVEFWHRWDDDLSCTVARMKQAIADVESCMEVS